jgi:hypothetical protein
MFQLTKIWVDPNDRVDTVEIRYAWSALGEKPKWDGSEEAEVMMVIPSTQPKIRQATLEIPRYFHNKDHYLLHYRFGGGGEHHEGFSNILTEEIVAREIPYIDNEGSLTEVRILWGVDGWFTPNWSQARLQGLPLRIAGDTPGHDAEGEGIADEAIYELIQTVPPPRRYLGKIWGPRSATIQYCFQLLRINTPIPGDEFVHWDNNNRENYAVTLD